MGFDNPDDRLLHELGAIMQAQRDTSAERWSDVVRGLRTLDEVSAEARADNATEAEIERDRALFAPLTEDRRKSIEASVVALIAKSATGLSVDAHNDSHADPASQPGTSSTIPLTNERGRRSFPWALVGGVALAAAAVVVWQPWTPSQPDPASLVADTQTLPAYRLEAYRGLVTKRALSKTVAEPGERLLYQPDTEMTWVLHPAQDTAAAVELAVFASREEASTRRLELAPITRLSSTGSIHVSGLARTLQLPPGDWTLTLVVAESGSGPTKWPVSNPDPSWQIETLLVRLEPNRED